MEEGAPQAQATLERDLLELRLAAMTQLQAMQEDALCAGSAAVAQLDGDASNARGAGADAHDEDDAAATDLRQLVLGWRCKAHDLLLTTEQYRRDARRQALESLEALEVSAAEIRALRQRASQLEGQLVVAEANRKAECTLRDAAEQLLETAQQAARRPEIEEATTQTGEGADAQSDVATQTAVHGAHWDAAEAEWAERVEEAVAAAERWRAEAGTWRAEAEAAAQRAAEETARAAEATRRATLAEADALQLSAKCTQQQEEAATFHAAEANASLVRALQSQASERVHEELLEQARAIDRERRAEQQAAQAAVDEALARVASLEAALREQREHAEAAAQEVASAAHAAASKAVAEAAAEAEAKAAAKAAAEAAEKLGAATAAASEREASLAERVRHLEREAVGQRRELTKEVVTRRSLEREVERQRAHADEVERTHIEHLQGRLSVRDAELASVRKERNALLSALRTQQRQALAQPPTAPLGRSSETSKGHFEVSTWTASREVRAEAEADAGLEAVPSQRPEAPLEADAEAADASAGRVLTPQTSRRATADGDVPARRGGSAESSCGGNLARAAVRSLSSELDDLQALSRQLLADIH